MAPADIDSVNHVGLVVADLRPAAARFEAMGFTLSELSMHKGATEPGKPSEPFGSGNRCAVFPKNYVELLAHVEKDKRDVFVGKYLARFEGMHIICFNSPALPAADARLRAAGVGTSGVIPLQRDVSTDGGTRTAKFDCAHFAEAGTPEGLVQAAYHRTPQYIHQARHLAHANKCVALSNAYVAAEDVAGVAARYATYTGRTPRRDGAMLVFDLPLVSRVTIIPMAELAAELPGAVPHRPPYMPGFGIAATDLAAVTGHLDRARIPYARARGRVVVPASAAFGAAIAFEAA